MLQPSIRPYRPIISRFVALCATLVTVLGVVLMPASAARADTGDFGYEGPVYSGKSSPSADKPQSKVWYNDGYWWASMLTSTSQQFHIFRLNRGTETWTDTGTVIDTRPNTSSDALWDGGKLYVASHVAVSSSSNSTSGKPAWLNRYSYNGVTKTYSLDAGFPSKISDFSSESLTMDEDSTGRLWATFTRLGKVYVGASNAGGTTWSTPSVLPTSGTTVSSDDISALVSFNGKIGLMWSNQKSSPPAMYFATHLDSAPVGTWQPSTTITSGPFSADDHINLKALEADDQGRVFGVIKTSYNDDPSRPSTAPLINLVEYNSSTGAWSSATFGTVADNHTRPIVMLDGEHHRVYVFATGPSTPGQTVFEGTIYMKSTPIDSLSFPAGLGTPVIRDASSAHMNNVTSSKQTVNSASGLIVLATNDTTKHYWHADIPLS
jgi:hypothetical protein